MNRRQALIGYITFRVGRRLIRGRLSDIRPGGRRDTQGGQMSKDSSRSLAGVAALLETVRPIVQKAASDPEFHGAVKQAFSVGKEVNEQVSGKPPSAIARKLAYDRRLQRKVENSALDLQKAVVGLMEPAQEEAPHPGRDHEDRDRGSGRGGGHHRAQAHARRRRRRGPRRRALRRPPGRGRRAAARSPRSRASASRRRSTAGWRPCGAWTWRSRTGPSSACSAPTGPARPR